MNKAGDSQKFDKNSTK